jgi:TRAP-type C4-dicarboxylate transport system substrate-binding protein
MRRLLLLLLVAALGAAACGRDTAIPTWRFALEEIEGSVQDAYARRFAEEIEQRLAGAVSVLVYPYGSLGTSAQITEQVQRGAIQLAFASPGHLGSVVQEAQIFSLHFLFSEDDEINREVMAPGGRVHEILDEAYRERGLALLAIVPEGWMVWTGDRPLRSPEDFRGFKMRTMASPLLVDAYSAYGASPTPLPYGEVYGALQLGMVDGQVNPVFAIEEMSFHEVQDVMTFARHLPFVTTLVANPTFLDALSPAEREALDAVVAELEHEIAEVERKLNAERLERIREAGGTRFVHLTEEEREVFREASLPVRERYRALAGERGSELLRTLSDELRRIESARADR